MNDYRTCRFCHKDDTNLLKYGTRHYAHAECGMEAQGAAAFLSNFTDWQLTHRFPYVAANRAGVGHLIDAASEREKALNWTVCETEGCTRYAVEGEDYCPDCRDNRAEAAYERSLGEAFRGGEAEAYNAEQQAWIQRNLK